MALSCRLIAFVCFALASIAHAHSDCFEHAQLGHSCWLEVAKVRPTQLTYGLVQVERRQEKIRDMSRRELRDYLASNSKPIVIGPGSEIFLIDGHHLSSAMLAEFGEEATILADVIEDWRDLDSASFWRRMQQRHFLWLYDEEGSGPLPVSRLPQNLEDLVDDPFRSLAWGVRKEGGFLKTEVPHADFVWAEFFREHISRRAIERSFDDAVEAGLELAWSPLAASLPGFCGDL